VVLETALPAKFEDAIQEAIGQFPERPLELKSLESLPQRVEVMQADVAALKAFIASKIDV
jgi:threonine synthase